MAYSLMGQSGHTTYGIKEFVLDTIDDLENLPINIPAGSYALVIATSQVFMLNTKGEWKEI